MSIFSFRNKGTHDIAEGVRSKAAPRILPVELHGSARLRLNILDAANSLAGLSLPGFRLEKLRGDREGEFSIRINKQYRICFAWENGAAKNVQITDYH